LIHAITAQLLFGLGGGYTLGLTLLTAQIALSAYAGLTRSASRSLKLTEPLIHLAITIVITAIAQFINPWTAHIADSITVRVELIGVGLVCAVIAGITYPITIHVSLIGVSVLWTKVTGIT
jgi:hypothetical protein